ncbi:tpr protein [Fusarium austroafricanum]|uniref:Tpr protein n=1 Tax=Fusarium austroafricanum TaxID=2364996 RepID=A0A8H4KUQ7_9HYPO|nr:tpr protein [Fusarium austroafricanum]
MFGSSNSQSLSPILTTRHTELLPRPCAPVAIQDGSFKPTWSELATGEPSKSNPTAYGYQDNENEKTQSSRGEDEEDLASRACRPITSKKLDAPIKSQKIPALAEQSPPNHENGQRVALSASTTKKPGIQEALLLKTGITLQRPTQDFGWDRMESNLVLPGYLGKPYYTSPAKHSRTQETSSASPGKRKLDSTSDEEYDRGLKRRGIHAYDTRGDTYEAIAISLTLRVAKKRQEKTWRYEWNPEQQSWVNKGAPSGMKELSREKACTMLEFLTIEVQPASRLSPVSLKAAQAFGGLFNGFDEKNGRGYTVKPEIMFQMLQMGVTGQSLVTRYMPSYY